ncbi:MAG: MBOAT family protein [Leptospiraceae bacterium]|nr:MBOAT family protein [Leptospiraceae bacterium]MCK6380769.1 MBOAT family protein [Leptospiraceae bacterium]NUM41139.1 MBOAT family protein [Leptospiraceae bacterium]
MLFNSVHFLGFFLVTIVIGNILKQRPQRIFLLFASFYFYMAWNINFIVLLLSSTVLDYLVALGIDKVGASEKQRKLLLSLSIFGNLGLLSYFKYTNFLLGVVGDLNFINSYRFPIYNITLPVGISFYTFQSMSYTIDVYRKQIEARKSFIDFSLYVAFFPQLVAGPIVRATTFFRDLDDRLNILNEDIQIAISRILIGFTRKIVFADNLGKVVDETFRNYSMMNPLEIWTGAIAFGWQIYFDFAGYTDIAIGVARLFGFKFDANFQFPMTVRNISEHWTKWHISFTTWIRDYIFIPLGGSRGSVLFTYRNIFITWLFGGVWHGAAYHYIAWGVWQGIMITIHREYSKTKLREFFHSKGGLIYNIFSRFLTMYCLGFGFVMFRAETMTKAWEMIQSMLFLKNISQIKRYANWEYGVLLIICFFASSFFSKRNIEFMATSKNKLTYLNIAAIFLLLIFGVTESQNFLYFAF